MGATPSPSRAFVLFVMGSAKFGAQVRQWRTAGPQADGIDGRLKHRTERNLVESFLAARNGGFEPFRYDCTFFGSQNAFGRRIISPNSE